MKRGLVLGKFMPPHAGHRLLFDFSKRFVDSLTILVCSRSSDPIPGALRQSWIAAMFPDCRVAHFSESALPADIEDPSFWRAWRENIRRHHPEEIDYLITPEAYGRLLADKLGVRHVHAPDRLSVAGTDIRNDPFLHWSSIPDCVRPYFVKRVCARSRRDEPGPTLAERLAQAFGTIHVPAFVAGDLDDDERSRAQRAANRAVESRANRVVFLESDDGYGGDAEPGIDLYLDAADVADENRERPASAIEAVLRAIPALAPYLVAPAGADRGFAKAPAPAPARAPEGVAAGH